MSRMKTNMNPIDTITSVRKQVTMSGWPATSATEACQACSKTVLLTGLSPIAAGLNLDGRAEEYIPMGMGGNK